MRYLFYGAPLDYQSLFGKWQIKQIASFVSRTFAIVLVVWVGLGLSSARKTVVWWKVLSEELAQPSLLNQQRNPTLRERLYRWRFSPRLNGIRGWVKEVYFSSFRRPGVSGKMVSRESYEGWEAFRDLFIRHERLWKFISQRHRYPTVYYPGFGRELIEVLIATDFGILVGVELERNPEFISMLDMLVEGIDWEPNYQKKKKWVLRLLDDYLEGNPAPHPSIVRFRQKMRNVSAQDFDDRRWELLGEISADFFENFQRMVQQQLSLLPGFDIQKIRFEENGKLTFIAIFEWQGKERKIVIHYGKDAYDYFPPELLSGYQVLFLHASELGFINIQEVWQNLVQGGIVVGSETLSQNIPKNFSSPYSLDSLGINEPAVTQLKWGESNRIFLKGTIEDMVYTPDNIGYSVEVAL